MIKLSLSQFYREVTNSKTGNGATVRPALKRWGVEWDETLPPRSRCVPYDQLPAARRAYKADLAVRREALAESAARMREIKATKAATNGEAKPAKLHLTAELVAALATLTARVVAVEEIVQAIGVTVENINSRTFRWEKDQSRITAAKEKQS